MDIIRRYEPSGPIEARSFANAEEASLALREGNRRHQRMAEQVQGAMLRGEMYGPIVIPSNPLSLGFSLVVGEAPAQRPFGIVLGCSDARAPIELIFDQSHNELFVVRVAGNVLGTECLGSIEYAAWNFAPSVRLVVVLGHTGCGAVAAAVELYLNPDSYDQIAVTYSLRSIVDRILVGVRLADQALGRRFGPDLLAEPSYKAALWRMAVYLNAALTARDLARELRDTGENGMDVVYGVYDLPTQKVESAPGLDTTFAPAPRNATEFAELTDRLADAVLSGLHAGLKV